MTENVKERPIEIFTVVENMKLKSPLILFLADS